jgi:aspartate aminotransferase-like enzyme
MIPEYFVDFEKWIPIMENPAKYFATPAVNLVWAMAEATKIIEEEGLQARADRHRKNADAIAKALEAIGCKILADESCRASTLSVAIYPEGVDDAKFRSTMLDQGVVVANALGAYNGKAFRLGHMGNIDINDEVACLGVIERALIRCGVAVEPGKAIGIYMAEMAK